MTIAALNPFPDYAVTRLVADPKGDAVTVTTPPITKARELVKTYLARVGEPPASGRTNAALCAIRGDYGTGKTHLLNDVASQLQAACKSTGGLSILRATCVQTDPLSWFRSQVGPQLDQLPLYETAVLLYGQAGGAVARKTTLTGSAADLLEKDPKQIVKLVRENHLSIDDVGREFEKLLSTICNDYDPVVRRVLARLVVYEGAARRWISGATLPAREAELLDVPPSIASAEQASAVIGAIAAMHRAVKRPFVVLLDELEHFTRFDLANDSWINMTWLKRLLEELGGAGGLALVAGHWSAWDTTKDYLDRFPQYAPIDLVKLDPSDVIDIASTMLDRSPDSFPEEHARVIATVTDGNMRRVMSLCNLLFRQTDGFRRELTEKQIHDAWTSVAQRIPQQQAMEQIAALLTARGFDVTMDKTYHDIPFDLVANRNDERVILVQAKHSITQSDHYAAARLFIDKLAQAAAYAKDVIGMFLANGSIDDELLSLLRGSGVSSLRWFDLTTRDAIENITAAIDAVDKPRGSPGWGTQRLHGRPERIPAPPGSAAKDAISADSATLRALNAELEKKLRELDERRSQETLVLQERLEKLAREVNSPRIDSVRAETEISPERARASYEAMLEPPTLNRILHYIGRPLSIGMTLVTAGVILVLMRREITFELATADSFIVAVAGMGVTLIFAGFWTTWRSYSRVSEYFEFSRQAIRDLYVRDVPIAELAKVNMVFRRAIDRQGPYRAHSAAELELDLARKEGFLGEETYYHLVEIAVLSASHNRGRPPSDFVIPLDTTSDHARARPS